MADLHGYTKPAKSSRTNHLLQSKSTTTGRPGPSTPGKAPPAEGWRCRIISGTGGRGPSSSPCGEPGRRRSGAGSPRPTPSPRRPSAYTRASSSPPDNQLELHPPSQLEPPAAGAAASHSSLHSHAPPSQLESTVEETLTSQPELRTSPAPPSRLESHSPH